MLSDREGQRVPNVTFRTRQNNQWVDVSTDDLFAEITKMILLSYTRCLYSISSLSLPGYNELA